MKRPNDIPQRVWEDAQDRLYAAFDRVEAAFGKGSFISSGMWEALIEADARAILAERERIAVMADEYARIAAEPALAVFAAAIRKGTP